MKKKHNERRVYTKEFKEEAVRLVFEDGNPINEVARDIDIHQNLIYRWRDSLKVKGEDAFPGRGKNSGLEEEIKRLKKELKVAQEERDILKKALRIFSVMPNEDTDS